MHTPSHTRLIIFPYIHILRNTTKNLVKKNIYYFINIVYIHNIIICIYMVIEYNTYQQ